MAVGLVLAGGLAVQSPKPIHCGMRGGAKSKVQRLKFKLQVGFMLVAAGVMGFGMLKSYSRGAWFGAAVGLAYLGYQIGKAENLKAEIRPGLLRWAGRRWVALAVIFASIGLLAFWSFRHTDRAVARCAYSVANANDFSWRKRVAAYEGALQMLADKPWFGFGWNQPEQVYDRYYRAAKVDEGMAIQLNDYLTLGMTLGVPALVCFAMYVGLSLSPRSKVRSSAPEVQNPKSKVQSPEDGRQRRGLPARSRPGIGCQA
jgi:O-antigen ligase